MIAEIVLRSTAEVGLRSMVEHGLEVVERKASAREQCCRSGSNTKCEFGKQNLNNSLSIVENKRSVVPSLTAVVGRDMCRIVICMASLWMGFAAEK